MHSLYRSNKFVNILLSLTPYLYIIKKDKGSILLIRRYLKLPKKSTDWTPSNSLFSGNLLIFLALIFHERIS